MQQSLRALWSSPLVVALVLATGCTNDNALPRSLTGPEPARPPLFQVQGDNILASDNFNRTDQNPIAGNWTSLGPPYGMAIGDNRVVPSSIDAYNWAYYSGISWPDDQYSKARLYITGSAGGDRGMGLLVRQSASAETYYRLVVDHASNSNVGLSKRIAGSYTNLASFSQSWTDGDVWELRVSGTTLQVFRNDTQVGTDVTDASIASGYAGIAYSSTETSAALDDWEGGSVDDAPPPLWSHEPIGFTPVLDYDFGDTIAQFDGAQFGTSGVFANNAGGHLSRISDATAPFSGPYAMQWHYPAGMIDGISPGTVYSGRGIGSVTDHFAGYYFKYSDPFDFHPTQNKQWYPHSETNKYIIGVVLVGGVPKMVIQIVDNTPDSYNLVSNVSNPTITVGVWHKLEVEFRRSSTPSTNDAVIRWWLDDVLLGNYTAAEWPAVNAALGRTDCGAWENATWDEWQFAPTWGGNEERHVAYDGDLWVDHLHVSAP